MNSISQILEVLTLNRMAIEMSGRGNHDLALETLNIAVTLAPKFGSAVCEMGCCYEKLGRYPEAISKFETVLEMHPSHIEAKMNKNRILEKIRSDK